MNLINSSNLFGAFGVDGWMTFSIFLANLRLCLMKPHLTLLLTHICPNYNAFEPGLKYLYLKTPHKTPKNHANFPMLLLQSMGNGKTQKKFRDVWGGQTANALHIFAFWSHILKKMFTKCCCEPFHFIFQELHQTFPILSFCWLEYLLGGVPTKLAPLKLGI